MRQDLFSIPGEFHGVPVFGFGILFAVWGVASLAIVVWLVRRHGVGPETRAHVPLIVLFGAAILFLLPRMLDGPPHQQRLPIRGFGVMLLVAVSAGLALAVRRARQMRVDPEVIFSLALWLFIPGIIGARLFYVIENWSDFHRLNAAAQFDLWATLGEIANVTKGGLVVYGSFLASTLSFVFFVVRYRLPALALADLIAPSLILGQGLGRLGCFLNGCCFGGLCDVPWEVTFPPKSPPYVRQMQEGLLAYRIRLTGAADTPPRIRQVLAGSPAERAGLKPGDLIVRINGRDVARLDEAQSALFQAAEAGEQASIEIAGVPTPRRVPSAPNAERSLPVHPTQIYSLIDGLLICLFLLAWHPFRRRDGELLAWLLTIYPVTRYLMEIIRDDEPKSYHLGGISLTIAQLISLVILAAAAALWIYLWRRPPGRVFDHPPQGALWGWTLAGPEPPAERSQLNRRTTMSS